MLFTQQPIVIDQVAATVNDEIITLSDIDKALAFYPTLRQLNEDEEQFYLRVLNELIDYKVVSMEFGQEFTLSDEDFEPVQTEAINKAGSLEKLLAAMKRFDMEWRDFHAFIRDKVIYEKVLREKFPQRFAVEFAEVERFYNQHYLPLQQRLQLEPRPLAEMAPVIEDHLRQIKTEENLTSWLQELKQEYRIDIKLGSH